MHGNADPRRLTAFLRDRAVWKVVVVQFKYIARQPERITQGFVQSRVLAAHARNSKISMARGRRRHARIKLIVILIRFLGNCNARDMGWK